MWLDGVISPYEEMTRLPPVCTAGVIFQRLNSDFLHHKLQPEMMAEKNVTSGGTLAFYHLKPIVSDQPKTTEADNPT